MYKRWRASILLKGDWTGKSQEKHLPTSPNLIHTVRCPDSQGLPSNRHP
jgi:hypothetical protein